MAEPLDDVVRRVIGYDRSHVVAEYRALARELATFAPVLDLGCGSGTLLDTLRVLGVESRGVDASATAVAAIRQRGGSVEHGDLLETLRRTADGTYGSVFAGHVVEHLPPDQARTMFSEVWRVLRAGGRFVILTPNPKNLYVAGEGFWIDPTHVRPYPAALLRALAADAKFTSVRVRGWRTGMPLRQLMSGALRWIATGGLHSVSPSLLCVATK